MRKKLNKEKEKIGKIGKKEKSKKKEKWKIKVISAGYTISARHLINYFFHFFLFPLFFFHFLQHRVGFPILFLFPPLLFSRGRVFTSGLRRC